MVFNQYSKNTPYIAGMLFPLQVGAYHKIRKENLDARVAVEKLYQYFGIDTMLICGGGMVNWTFLQQGCVDELSLILVPAADGNPDSVTVSE